MKVNNTNLICCLLYLQDKYEIFDHKSKVSGKTSNFPRLFIFVYSLHMYAYLFASLGKLVSCNLLWNSIFVKSMHIVSYICLFSYDRESWYFVDIVLWYLMTGQTSDKIIKKRKMKKKRCYLRHHKSFAC